MRIRIREIFCSISQCNPPVLELSVFNEKEKEKESNLPLGRSLGNILRKELGFSLVSLKGRASSGYHC